MQINANENTNNFKQDPRKDSERHTLCRDYETDTDEENNENDFFEALEEGGVCLFA